MRSGLGVDLGAGLTKLARADANGRAGGTVAPVRTVPTVVAYRGRAARIPPTGPGSAPDGWSSGAAADHGIPGEVRYDGFAAMLGTGSASEPAAQHHTPEQVADEFLRLLLQDYDLAAAGPTAMSWAAAVPPGLPDEAARPGLPSIFSAPGRSSPRLLATPVAILLYLRHSRPDVATASRFVVCDLGASSVTLSLCTLAGYRIRVVDSIRVEGTSFWTADTRDYADVGDRLPTLVEGLAMALTGADDSLGPADRVTSVRYWRELEQALADDEQRERLDAVLEQALADPQRYGGTGALRVSGITVTAAQLLRACAPLAERCATELARLLRRQGDPAWLRSGPAGTRVVLAGGLSVLRPLRAALLSAAGLDPAAPGGGAVGLDDAERVYAPAFGVALVAAGLTEPGDRYPHALRLPVHYQVRDRIVAGQVELAAAGSIDLDRADPVFARQQGEKIRVLIRPPAGPSPGPIRVEVVLADSGAAEPAAFYPRPGPPPGLYHIGVRGHPNGAAVVLQRVDSGEQVSYPLMELAPPEAQTDDQG